MKNAIRLFSSGATQLAFVIAVLTSISAKAFDTEYSCRSNVDPTGVISLIIASGTPSGVKSIHHPFVMDPLTSPGGTQANCIYPNQTPDVFALTVGDAGGLYTFEFPNPIFSAPKSLFTMNLIIDHHRSDQQCFTQQLNCTQYIPY